MITFYGVSISVHVRKAVVTAIAKGIDYKLEPVLPRNPPPNWLSLSPTGQVPAMQDGDFTLSELSALSASISNASRRSRRSCLSPTRSTPARCFSTAMRGGWRAA